MKEWWRVASMIGLITGCTVDADPAPPIADYPTSCQFVLVGDSRVFVCDELGGRAGLPPGGASHSAGTAPVPLAGSGGASAGGTTWEAAGGATEVGGRTMGAGGVSVGGTGSYEQGGTTSVAGMDAGGVSGGGVSVCSDFLVPHDPTLTSEQRYEFEQSICANVGGIVALVITTPSGDVLTCCAASQEAPSSGGGGAGGTTNVMVVTGGVAPR